MPTNVTLKLKDEYAEILLQLKEGKEDLNAICARLLTDLVEAPHKEEITGMRSMLVPPFFHKLGTCFDRVVAEDVFPPEKQGPANTARISSIRTALGIDAYRRQGKPRKFNDEERIEKWKIIKEADLNNTAIQTALNFRRGDDAIAWAESVGLDDLVEKLKGGRRRKKVEDTEE